MAVFLSAFYETDQAECIRIAVALVDDHVWRERLAREVNTQLDVDTIVSEISASENLLQSVAEFTTELLTEHAFDRTRVSRVLPKITVNNNEPLRKLDKVIRSTAPRRERRNDMAISCVRNLMLLTSYALTQSPTDLPAMARHAEKLYAELTFALADSDRLESHLAESLRQLDVAERLAQDHAAARIKILERSADSLAAQLHEAKASTASNLA